MCIYIDATLHVTAIQPATRQRKEGSSDPLLNQGSQSQPRVCVCWQCGDWRVTVGLLLVLLILPVLGYTYVYNTHPHSRQY